MVLKGLVFVVFQSENRCRLFLFWSGNSGFGGTIGVINVFVVLIPNELERKSNMQISSGFYEIFLLAF